MKNDHSIFFNPPPQVLKAIEGVEAARVALNAQDKPSYLYKKLCRPIPLILGIAALCLFGVFMLLEAPSITLPTILLIPGPLIFYTFYKIDKKRNKALQKYHKSYIDGVVMPMINQEENQFSYNKSGCIFKKYGSVFKENFPELQPIKSEDLLEGMVDNTIISLGEIHVDFKKWESVFCFLCCVAELNKDIPSKIIVHSRKTEGTLPQIDTSGLQEIALESRAFNRIYQVYAQNEIEARYILSPIVIENMVALHYTFNGVFWFQNRQLWFLGIDINSDTNLFEVRKDSPIYQQAENTYMTVQRLLQMIKTVGANL